MSRASYKLEELARAAGTSARTVRYYVQRGLLPAPAFRGKDTAYDAEHLVRLRAIRRFQDAFFPLDAIAIELERRTLEELGRIADGSLPVTPSAAVDLPSAPLRAAAMARGRVLERFELAPGVELTITEDAPPESRLLVATILETRDRQGAK